MAGKRKRKISIVAEVAILFLVCTLITGSLVYFFADGFITLSVATQTEKRAEEITDTAKRTITEYKAYPWLIQYWYDHADTLDVEYDTALKENSKTADKCRTFSQRHPDLELNYMNEAQCEALPAEDQKLYAEIVYSQLLARLDEIKRSFHVDYLYCVISEEPFDQQFFLFSAAEPGADRGRSPDKIYTLGTVVDVDGNEPEAMREAAGNEDYLAASDKMLDHYSKLSSFGEHNVLIGLSFSLADLTENINMMTHIGAAIAIFHQIILALICLLALFIFMLRPFKKVHRSIRSYTETKDSKAARLNLKKIRSHNELGQIADDMIDLTKEIDAYTADIKRITSEQERIETELELASKIQSSMLPETSRFYPDRSEFRIHASMDPAKEVGGDFYDLFLIDEDHLCMIIADVSDKGVPAALFMMESKIVIAQDAKAGKTPAQILTDANQVISSNNPMHLFVTVWIGILEISTGKLVAANAGHEYPVIKAPGEGFEIVKDEHDFVVGFMDGIEYHEYEMRLEPGTTLFLYTDGVPEAMNAGEESFGMERMLAALNEGADLAPEQLLRHVRSAVDEYVEDAEQFDDLTMLCLEYRKQEDL